MLWPYRLMDLIFEELDVGCDSDGPAFSVRLLRASSSLCLPSPPFACRLRPSVFEPLQDDRLLMPIFLGAKLVAGVRIIRLSVLLPLSALLLLGSGSRRCFAAFLLLKIVLVPVGHGILLGHRIEIPTLSKKQLNKTLVNESTTPTLFFHPLMFGSFAWAPFLLLFPPPQ